MNRRQKLRQSEGSDLSNQIVTRTRITKLSDSKSLSGKELVDSLVDSDRNITRDISFELFMGIKDSVNPLTFSHSKGMSERSIPKYFK